MKNKTRRLAAVLGLAAALFLLLSTTVFAAGEEPAYVSNMYATFWSLVPPIVAIVLALISKEVYISLFVGILTGALFYANFSPVLTFTSIVAMFTEKLSDSWNVGILIFLVVLGVMVALMNKAGGSAAYGRWAAQRIKSRKGALLATFGLGVLIFIDDYFNCLTVGSVMLPVTDKFKISRAKLAYIIDATAAPVCIIAPISSWAAAVTSSATGDVDGFAMFLQTIPYNFYALLTIVMVVCMSLMDFDFGPMKRYEQLARDTGDLYGGTGDLYGADDTEPHENGKVIDLVLPVLVLILFCIIGMVYTGGFFEGVGFIKAFAGSDASVGLALGSILALIFSFIYFLARRVISFKGFADCLPDGFRQMVPAILILSFAWTLAGFCRDALGAGDFVGSVVHADTMVAAVIPPVMFLIALGIAFATGTSWGTFAILIPIAQAVFPTGAPQLLIITVAGILAGAVCGDHCSPISDTTIMASTGARVSHIIHVSTQMPYALLVAAISAVCFLVAGLVQRWYVVLPLGALITVGVLFFLRYITRNGETSMKKAVK